MSAARDPTARFSDRVADYLRFRPGYPERIVDELRGAGFLDPEAVAADLGCGTGILTRLLLRAGHRVIGVEPNGAMLAAARDQLDGFERFEPVGGRAEATGLPDASVDLAVAGQAFHWFEPQATARELRRIVRPPVAVALISNDRVVDDGGPMAAYEALVREYGTDYAEIRGGRVDEAAVDRFFAAGSRRLRFDNAQRLDLDGLIGRIFSCSYMPAAGEPGHGAARRAVVALFERHAAGGSIELRYDTTLHLGRLGEPASV